MVQMERAIDVPQTLIQYDAKATCNYKKIIFFNF